MRTILTLLLFTVFVMNAPAQTKQPDNKTLKEQAEQRRNYPDNLNKKVVIADKQSDSAAAEKPKKKGCWFRKKSKKKPAAKDALKDRNTKDPKLDTPIKQAEKLDSNL